jgi:hypothetical protein
MDSPTARVALHRSARSRGYKLLREGANPRSLLRGDVCGCFWRGVCVVVPLVLIFLDVAPASPFIVSKERTRVTFVVKRGNGEKMKGKSKKVASGAVVFLLIRWEQFPL